VVVEEGKWRLDESCISNPKIRNCELDCRQTRTVQSWSGVEERLLLSLLRGGTGPGDQEKCHATDTRRVEGGQFDLPAAR